MSNAYLAERAHDLFDLEDRLLDQLLQRRQEGRIELTAPTIVLAHDLTPSETARLDRKWVLGFVTEAGGEGGHTAILAKGLELPAVVGTGPLLADVASGDLMIVDGDQGVVLIRPDDEEVARYREQVQRRSTRIAELACLRDLPSETADGHRRVSCWPTSSFLTKSRPASGATRAASGCTAPSSCILGSDTEPTEEDHFRAYREVVQAMGDRPVVIRTLDLGADKMGHLPRTEDEHNPFLGLRSIRLSLRNVDLFRTQLRAILRASAWAT